VLGTVCTVCTVCTGCSMEAAAAVATCDAPSNNAPWIPWLDEPEIGTAAGSVRRLLLAAYK
jgi:hypothetical protein